MRRALAGARAWMSPAEPAWLLYIVVLHQGSAHESEALRHIPPEHRSAAQGEPEGTWLMGYDAQAIADVRRRRMLYLPAPPRDLSYLRLPRVHRAAGMNAGAGRSVINERVALALRISDGGSAPGTSRRDRGRRLPAPAPGAFPGGHIPSRPADIAVLAVKSYTVFMQPPANDVEAAAGIVTAAASSIAQGRAECRPSALRPLRSLRERMAADFVIARGVVRHVRAGLLTDGMTEADFVRVYKEVVETTAFIPWAMVLGSATTVAAVTLPHASPARSLLPRARHGHRRVVYILALWEAVAAQSSTSGCSPPSRCRSWAPTSRANPFHRINDAALRRAVPRINVGKAKRIAMATCARCSASWLHRREDIAEQRQRRVHGACGLAGEDGGAHSRRGGRRPGRRCHGDREIRPGCRGHDRGQCVRQDRVRFVATAGRHVRRGQALAALAPLAGKDWDGSVYTWAKHAAYIWCADGILESTALGALMKELAGGGTTRNWATLGKIHALMTAVASARRPVRLPTNGRL
jgi:hypothetical protein